MSLDELNQDYIIFAEDDQISDYVLTNSVKIYELISHLLKFLGDLDP